MANNFFDLVKDSFFYPLTNKNKRMNYDLLQLINYKMMSLDKIQVEKEEIVNWIVDYFDNKSGDFLDDEDNKIINNVKSYAYNKVNYFIKCGWLIEDFEGIRVIWQLDENGIKILTSMDNAVKEDNSSLEFSGFVYNIYNNLINYNSDHAVDIIEQIYNASKDLNKMLRGLNVNIKKFLTKLINENEARPREILETIFFDYQKKVILKAFKNFREKDNPSKYKTKIEDKIDELLEKNNFEIMIDNYINIKCNGINSIENRNLAKEFFESKLFSIRDQFEEIEDYILILDGKNTKYITTAQSRLNFLINEEIDIEGRIINCLKGLKYIDDDFLEEGYFELYSGLNIDEYSLYTPKIRKLKPKIEPIIDDSNDNKEEVSNLFDELFKKDEFSVKEINKYILNHLKNNTQIHAKNLIITNFEDLIKLFLSQLYSENSIVDYKINFLDDYYDVLGYKTKDFIIERKNK